MHAVMRGEPVDQREVDYVRGYFDALDWMTGLPVRMRSKLNRSDCDQRRREQQHGRTDP